jgi:hypothetical protein
MAFPTWAQNESGRRATASAERYTTPGTRVATCVTASRAPSALKNGHTRNAAHVPSTHSGQVDRPGQVTGHDVDGGGQTSASRVTDGRPHRHVASEQTVDYVAADFPGPPKTTIMRRRQPRSRSER